MVRGGLFALIVALAAGCTKHNPDACCTTAADCEAKGLPAGTGCAEGEACVNNGCVAPSTCQASSDCTADLPFCDTERGVCAECLTQSDCGTAACTMGTCGPCASAADCQSGLCRTDTGVCGQNVVDAKYVPEACDMPASNAWNVPSTGTVTIDTAGACDAVKAQVGAPDICVVHYTNIEVAAGASVRAFGSRALAIVADGDITWSGTLDVSAKLADPGPGGAFTTSGTWPAPPTSPDDTQDAGGGGAGFRTAGASGGGAGVGNGGPPVSNIDAGMLLAGSRAAAMLDPSNMQIPAGLGGGGVTLVSCRGTIAFDGDLNASGGLGLAGLGGAYKSGGSGGGAGGNVLFQAAHVTLTGRFLANGGSGGVGYTGNGSPIVATPSFTQPCPNGPSSSPAGSGGTGGCGATPPVSGGATTQPATSTPGGGGGSVGFFRTATNGEMPVVTPAFAQPAFSPNEMIGRR